MGYQVSRSAASLRERAERAAEAGDLDEQVKLLGRYLRYESEDMEALQTYFQASRERSVTDDGVNWPQVVRTFTSLENAIREYPDEPGLRREAYLASRFMGRHSDALDHLEYLDELAQSNSDVTLTADDRVAWAGLLWLNNKQQEAVDRLCAMIGYDMTTNEFDDAAATDADVVGAYSLLAQIYVKDYMDHEDYTIPMQIMDKAVERNPDNADGHLTRARFVRQSVEGEEGQQRAMADLRDAIELAPRRAGGDSRCRDDRHGVARIRMGRGRVKKRSYREPQLVADLQAAFELRTETRPLTRVAGNSDWPFGRRGWRWPTCTVSCCIAVVCWKLNRASWYGPARQSPGSAKKAGSHPSA